MDTAGLSASDFAIAKRALLFDHERRISVDVLDLADGSHLRSLTPDFLDGQVAGDVTAEVTRMLDLRFLDAGNRLGFVPDDPSAAPLHRSREVRVHDERWIDTLGDWISWPVFTGPMWDFSRTGGEVRVTAHGRERQALGQLWDAMHFPAKSKITDAIRDLLAAVGDVNAQVPDLGHTLPHALTVHAMDSVWPHVKHLAAALDRYAFYDGGGRFRLRPFHQRTVYRFHDALTDRVTIGRTAEKIINTVLVLGPNPKGPKDRPRGVAILDGPLSPANLGRHGAPLHLVHKVERQHVKTNAQCQAIAERLLRELGRQRTDLSFPAMPLPFLEEHDPVSVTDPAFGTAQLRMRQWNLPLTGGEPGGGDGDPMTVGTVKRTIKAKVRK